MLTFVIRKRNKKNKTKMFHVEQIKYQLQIKHRMKKFTIYWQNSQGNELTTMEEAENLKKAIKQVSYFEKKTGYEITKIEMIKNGKEEETEILLDKQ